MTYTIDADGTVGEMGEVVKPRVKVDMTRIELAALFLAHKATPGVTLGEEARLMKDTPKPRGGDEYDGRLRRWELTQRARLALEMADVLLEQATMFAALEETKK